MIDYTQTLFVIAASIVVVDFVADMLVICGRACVAIYERGDAK